MRNLTQKQIDNRNIKVNDPSLPIAQRVKAHNEIMYEVMNPDNNFSPSTFDPKKGDIGYAAKKRGRVSPPRRLPTMGLLPKTIIEGQMVGMYESKQDLYLLIAWLCERVSDLEDNSI